MKEEIIDMGKYNEIIKMVDKQDDLKTQNDDIEKEDEDFIEVIDYYKKYGIDKNEKWETIKKANERTKKMDNKIRLNK